MTKIFFTLLLFLVAYSPAGAGFPGMSGMAFKQNPCATGSVAIGTVCAGGAIYAGIFPQTAAPTEKKIMIMPGGCDGTTLNPTCTGGTDSGSAVKKAFDNSSSGDITGLENVASASTKSLQNGDSATIATLDGLGTNYQAAKYCADMEFGGYTDWYLPSKSEMAYVYCKTGSANHNTIYPDEDSNCTSTYGGVSSELSGAGFNATPTDGKYWTSTEFDGVKAWYQSFNTGIQVDFVKTSSLIFVRCIRQY